VPFGSGLSLGNAFATLKYGLNFKKRVILQPQRRIKRTKKVGYNV
jgi:hypothetical protein